MDDGAADVPRYSLSFTTGALLIREATVLAPLYAESHDWEQVRARAVADNLLQARTHRTSVRLTQETVKRLSALSEAELDLMVEGSAAERAHLLWVAACRHYVFIGEFAEEVLRERFLVMANAVTYPDFDAFVQAKALWHDELSRIAESTRQRLRSNVFKMLQEADLLSPSGAILPAALSDRVASLLSARRPSDLRFFPTTMSGG